MLYSILSVPHDLQGVSKKVHNTIRNRICGLCLETRVLDQSSSKWSQVTQLVQGNLDGPKWSKKNSLPTCPQNFVRNFFWDNLFDRASYLPLREVPYIVKTTKQIHEPVHLLCFVSAERPQSRINNFTSGLVLCNYY